MAQKKDDGNDGKEISYTACVFAAYQSILCAEQHIMGG